MNLPNLTTIESVSLILFITGCIGIFTWFFIGAYITKKWMAEVSEILEDGQTFFTTGIIFGLHGILQYATVFFWSFHAKRFGMLEKREHVPKNIQRWYIFAYCWFMTSLVFLLISGALTEIYSD